MSIAQKSRRRRSWRSRTPSGSKRKLGADEAGNPRIEGKHGGVYGPAADLRPGTWSEFDVPAKAGHAVQTLDKRNDRLTR
jgi:hypothetical protein